MKSPIALVGARLPGDFRIRKAKLRGVESQGMLCSQKELGLGEGADGIMELSDDAPIGADVREYLQLDDSIIDIDLTPNRGDCFSLLGIARETAVMSRLDLNWPTLAEVAPVAEDDFPIEVLAPGACPRFCGRVVRGIDPTAKTPQWMREKLRRSGLRPIHPVVDVTNLVMMELGQPLHGFDLGQLHEGIIVRFAKAGESLTLLDGRVVELDEDMLVIADHSGPRALAGIMGGENTGVSEATADVFFEGAFFSPDVISGRARRLGLHTDASLRFERGVDPEGQRRAIERATQLLTEIAGGHPGPLLEVVSEDELPRREPVTLRRDRLAKVMGTTVEDQEVERVLAALGMSTEKTDLGWTINPPSWRFDIAIEEDLIEEIARVHGYDSIPETPERGDVTFRPVTESRVPENRLPRCLMERGYQEVVTYSFVDTRIQSLLFPSASPISLDNPISSEMTDMRVSLWPGLLNVLRQNLSRQQDRVRVFESGLRFELKGGEIRQLPTLGGLIAGPRYAEQWSAKADSCDYFDLKGDLEALFSLTGEPDRFRFEAAEHPALHPGQAARVFRGDGEAGWAGAVHPRILSSIGINIPAYLFELDVNIAFQSVVPEYRGISRFPAVRRDIAVLVDERIPSELLVKESYEGGGSLLREVRIFDVYRGERIDSGLKSIALGLILQETSRTLTDGEVDDIVSAVISRLERNLKARIRD
jgi:phenylalanyl-tRNA synthetase beta chain